MGFSRKSSNRIYRSAVEMIRDVAGEAEAKSLRENLAKKRIAHHLFGMRSARGVTQSEMAKLLKCSQGKVSKLENGEDDDLRIGELRNYIRALDHDLMLVICKKRWTLVEQIKFHACMIRSCLSKLTGLAQEDAGVRQGVQNFHVEALFNLVKVVLDSAKNLPNCPQPVPEIIEADEEVNADCGSEETLAVHHEQRDALLT